jgi:hypothetical protein
MRTTLDIDDDVLRVAKGLARREHRSVGEVISRLARHSLADIPGTVSSRTERAAPIGGFQPFAPRVAVVSNEQVDSLRDTEGA